MRKILDNELEKLIINILKIIYRDGIAVDAPIVLEGLKRAGIKKLPSLFHIARILKKIMKTELNT